MPALDPEPIRALGSRLRELRFAPAAIHEAFGLDDGLMRLRGDRAVQLRRLPPDAPLSTVIKLFLLGVPVAVGEVAAALPLDDLERLGLAERAGGDVVALVQLFPYEGLILASDRHDALELDGGSADYVGSVNPTSITLARLTVRRPVATALDVGTGCGVQALLAARHAERVVAVDVNPRATSFTRFNALLNALDNVECREGSFFEPVAGERFDLIVANPPFVISPDATFTFRDSGLTGDLVCERVVGEAPAHLTEDGLAHVLCCWATRAGGDWRDAPSRWLEGRGADGWVLHSRSEDPLAYAAAWNALVRVQDPEAYPAALDRWLGYYRELGIASLEYGAVLARRRAGANWLRLDELGELTGPAGEHIERVLAAADYLAEKHDPLADAFTLAPDHRIDQTIRLRDGELTIEQALIRLDGGLPFEGSVDGYALAVLGRCDGTRPLGEILDELGLDRTATGAVRRLLELGFLLAPGGRPREAALRPAESS